ncbi:MAG: ribonuclease HII [Paracoccaceae bacterium]
MPLPDFDVETGLIKKGYKAIAGVDEVGRGCIAGPVTAAAVILNPQKIPSGLNDSKKVSFKNREKIFQSIQDTCTFCVAHSSVEEIDQINILQASLLSMKRAILGLSIKPDFVLIDGNKSPGDLEGESETIVKGDSKSLSIAAASIVAKVTRDRFMSRLDKEFPGYDWSQNAGYPTKLHKSAILNIGITPYHRRSFKPVYNILYQENN